MSQYSMAEAEARLPELARRAAAGEDILIAAAGGRLIRLVPVPRGSRPRRPGSGKGDLLWMAPDFDETPEGFEDYT